MRRNYVVAIWIVLAALGCGPESNKSSDPRDAGAGNDADSVSDEREVAEAGSGAPADGGSPADAGMVCRLPPVFDTVVPGNDQVDLLFVVDDSGSMKEEQSNLAAQLPKLVRILASGRLEDETGRVIRQFPPVRSLHLGVVSSDMGVNGLSADQAARVGCPGLGKDGLLLNAVRRDDPVCASKTFDSKYLDFRAGADDAMTLGTDFTCITSLGTTGCGFEQQLEAMWKALAPSRDTSFSGDSAGHGDRENAGFLRPDSVLAVIHVSDEEDCSIPDSSRDLFDSTSNTTTLNVGCQRNPDLQHPASRYIQGLKSLRRTNPDQVIFAAIVGIPPEAEGVLNLARQDFDEILARSDMQYAELPPNAEGTVFMRPSCETANGRAYAPRRFVEVAKGFGRNGLLRSICRDDFSSALNGLIDKIADQLGRVEGVCKVNAECPATWRCAPPDSANAGLCLNPECASLL